MDNSSTTTTNGNGSTVEVTFDNDQEIKKPKKQTHPEFTKITLYSIFNDLIAAILFSQPDGKYGSAPFMHRVRGSVSDNFPLIKQGSRNSAHDVIQWTRRGSGLRAILVVSVGTIASLVLTGLLVFMLFFVAATVNAIVISLLVSLAAAGGFLAMFFACVTAIYIGALSIAAFAISIATISAIVAVTIATGWIGFFWTVWLATRGSIHFAKRSLNMTGSVLSSYSANRHGLQNN